jgi:hypothetical protein
MLLHASSAAYHPLFLVPARTGDRGGAPPRLHAAKLQTLNGLQLRSSFSALSCSCSPSPSPGDGGKRSARSLFDVIPFVADETPLPISVLQISLRFNWRCCFQDLRCSVDCNATLASLAHTCQLLFVCYYGRPI